MLGKPITLIFSKPSTDIYIVKQYPVPSGMNLNTFIQIRI